MVKKTVFFASRASHVSSPHWVVKRGIKINFLNIIFLSSTLESLFENSVYICFVLFPLAISAQGYCSNCPLRGMWQCERTGFMCPRGLGKVGGWHTSWLLGVHRSWIPAGKEPWSSVLRSPEGGQLGVEMSRPVCIMPPILPHARTRPLHRLVNGVE